MWKTAAAQNDMMDFANIKKEMKRMWNMHNVTERETFNVEYSDEAAVLYTHCMRTLIKSS
jgi:hypothetical protein